MKRRFQRKLDFLGRPTCGLLRRARAVGLLDILLMFMLPLCASGAELGEYQVKAGFIFNLIRFTEWPPNQLGRTGAIRLCTLGDDPFRPAFESLRDKMVKGKPIGIQHLDDTQSLEDCDLLFIGASERKHLARILASVKNRPLLSISEVDEFLESGGMVTLLIERERPVMEINASAARKAGLTISSQVLRLARRVID